MSVLDGEIIVRTIDVGGDDGCEVASIFLCIGAVHGIDETLGEGISFVRGVGWSIVEHGFVNGVGSLVGEDAGGKERNEFLNLVDSAEFHDVVIDKNILPVEFHLSSVGNCEDLGS